jgi:UDP-N-acetylglucosamine 2-epimerase (non-hydrolysing)
MEELVRLSEEIPVLFPVHPRTGIALERIGFQAGAPGLHMADPLGYMEFLSLMEDSAGVLTDSGGIQEEATYLGVPCLTLRDNTERPATVATGTNMLIGLRPDRIAEVPALLEEVRTQPPRKPPLWDGRASERIVNVLAGQPLHASGVAARGAAHRDGTGVHEVMLATQERAPELPGEAVA